jgi:NDP-sugar pyrophosphorylase family protein
MDSSPKSVREGEGRTAALALMKAHDIRQIPVLDSSGRPVGMETYTRHLGLGASNNWAVIMAGGIGARLAPLTDTMPKPLIAVGGKPVLEIIINNLRDQGIEKIFISVKYRAQMIEDHFGDGSDFQVSIEYLRETERRGTAGALSLLPSRPNEPIIVMNGDLLTSIDFASLLGFHTQHQAPATMCVRSHSVEVPFGVAEIDGHNLVGLVEKPIKQYFINAGIYALSPEAIDYVPSAGYYDMTMLFDRLIELKKDPAVFPIREYWRDIGHLQDLEKAREEFSENF